MNRDGGRGDDGPDSAATPAGVAAGWIQRLRERGVIRVAASYAVIAWLLLQIADVTFGPLGVPNWVMVALIVAAALGFPLAIALTWFYEVGDHGVERDTGPAGAPRPVVHGLRRHADIAIIGVLMIVVAVLLVRQAELARPAAGTPAIAVLPFTSLGSVEDSEVLALGVAESVLHQLAGLAEIDVIARASSFAPQNREGDVSQIGQRLKARYLLGGSVQRDGSRLRVMAYLTDTESGAQLWSMRFDRSMQDVFAVQDEIAAQVTEALKLSLSPGSAERLRARGTSSLEAYLAYLQGRALLATGRVTDVKRSVSNFEEAIRIDPRFADGYTSLAEARLLTAEFEVTSDRPARLEAARRDAARQIARALELDPRNGRAFLQRGYIGAFDDLLGAEDDYRRGLELVPNDARGLAGLASVVYEQPERREEALALLDRARKLDPLEPAHDVTKSAFLLYARGDIEGAHELLQDVLQRHPSYLPALARMTNLLVNMSGQTADGLRHGEQVLALDPLGEWARRDVIYGYVDIGDPAAAREVIEEAPNPIEARWLAVHLYDRDWRRAGEVAYRALEAGTVLASDEPLAIKAIRMHARATGDRSHALAVLQARSGVDWDGQGQPLLELRLGLKDPELGYADMLLLDGEDARAARLLEALLRQMDQEERGFRRGRIYYTVTRAAALAMLGRREEALAQLLAGPETRARVTERIGLEDDPVFDSLRTDARFQRLIAGIRDRRASQRELVEQMRRDGRLPLRGQ